MVEFPNPKKMVEFPIRGRYILIRTFSKSPPIVFRRIAHDCGAAKLEGLEQIMPRDPGIALFQPTISQLPRKMHAAVLI